MLFLISLAAFYGIALGYVGVMVRRQERSIRGWKLVGLE